MNEMHSQSTIGSGALVFLEDRVLLVQLNYGRAKGAWILPGGMVETGEHPAAAAVRETLEETNLKIKIVGLAGVRHRIEKQSRANIYYIFNGQVESGQTEENLKWPENEIMCARFWDVKAAVVDQQVRPLTREYIKKFLENPQGVLKNQMIPSDHHYNDELFTC